MRGRGSKGDAHQRGRGPETACTPFFALLAKQPIDDIDLLDTVMVETLRPEAAKYHPVYWIVFRFLELCLLDWIKTAIEAVCASQNNKACAPFVYRKRVRAVLL